MALAFTTYGVNFQVFDTLWGEKNVLIKWKGKCLSGKRNLLRPEVSTVI